MVLVELISEVIEAEEDEAWADVVVVEVEDEEAVAAVVVVDVLADLTEAVSDTLSNWFKFAILGLKDCRNRCC
jgi:hypothetical protein